MDVFLLLKDAFYLFGIVTFVVVYALVAGKYWRGEEGEPNDIAPSAWPFSRAHWNGVVRCYVAVGPFVAVFVSAGVLGARFEGTLSPALENLIFVVGGGSFLVMMCIYAGVILWNRPKFIVPPHLRGAPGLLEARRRSRNRR
jgi:hypothetical protein